MDHPILAIVMRYLHIVSAIAAVGGLIFAITCLRPALRVIEGGLSDSILQAVRRRFLKLQALSILGLIISGVYGWMVFAAEYRDMGPKGNALIGTKVLLAMILFGVVWARGVNLIKSEKAAQMINIHLAAIIILLGAVLRSLRLAAAI